MGDLSERNAQLERVISALQEILVERCDDIIRLRKQLDATTRELNRLRFKAPYGEAG